MSIRHLLPPRPRIGRPGAAPRAAAPGAALALTLAAFAAAEDAPKPGAGDAAPKPPPPAAAGAQDAKPPSPEGRPQPATIAGIVKFAGEKPAREPIREMAASTFCTEHCKGEYPLQEKWVFGRNGDDDTLQNVLVYVGKGLQGRTFPPPPGPVVIDQAGCLYAPHVTAVMTGQPLEIRNGDATLHNVMCNPRKNRGFNDGMPGGSAPLTKVFDQPELKIELRCFMHPWMQAYVHVLDHPFHAVTPADGTFTLAGLPPGDYEVSVLHESSRLEASPATLPVTLAAGETKRIVFTYRMKPPAGPR